MKLLRHGSPGQEKPGADGEIRDLSGIIPIFPENRCSPAQLKRCATLTSRFYPELPAGLESVLV